MFAVLLPILAFMVGLAQYTFFHIDGKIQAGPRTNVTAVTDATNFIVYRNALENYMEDHPTYTGTSIAFSDLELPDGATDPNQGGNYIQDNADGTKMIEAWYVPTDPGSNKYPQDKIEQDGTFGYDNNGTFEPYVNFSGTPPATSIPASPPAGSVISLETQIGDGH